MSKIPRPSPRLLRNLPVTDDKKSAALKKLPREPKDENIILKPLKKTVASSSVMPSTSKVAEESLKTTKNRQSEALKLSKTELAINLDHLSIQSKGRKTIELAKPETNLQNAVKNGEVSKGVSKLRPSLNFRDKRPKQESSPSNSKVESNAESNAKKADISSAMKTKTAEPSKFTTEKMLKNPKIGLNRSKTETAINLDHFSIRSKGRKTISTVDHATNLQPAVMKGEVPKGDSKLRKSLNFRDKRPIKFEEPKQEQSPSNSKNKSNAGNWKNISPASKNETGESSNSKSDKMLKNQEKLIRSKTESAINLEKFKKTTNASKITEGTRQIYKSSKEKDEFVKLMEEQDIYPEFKDNLKDASGKQIKFCFSRDIGHSGLKFIPKKKK